MSAKPPHREKDQWRATKTTLRNGSAQRMVKKDCTNTNAHTETRQSNARRVLVYIYHATASYRIGQQGSKIYNSDLSAAKTLLRGAFIKSVRE